MTKLARITALCVAIVAVAALCLHINNGLNRVPDRTLFTELWRTGRYFTILTVAVVGFVFARIALTGRASASTSTAVALWILIVGVVYHALLARELTGLRFITDQLLHTVVPVLVVLWWLVFAPKSGLRAQHAVWWLIWPGLYATYALIRGEFDGRHPYFFLDPPLTGWPKTVMWVLVLGTVFWLGGRGMIWLGTRLSRAQDHPADDGPRGPQPLSSKDPGQ